MYAAIAKAYAELKRLRRSRTEIYRVMDAIESAAEDFSASTENLPELTFAA